MRIKLQNVECEFQVPVSFGQRKVYVADLKTSVSTSDMTTTCNHCRFTFRWTGEIETCPDCGKPAVREATEKEKDEYRKNQAEYENIEKQA